MSAPVDHGFADPASPAGLRMADTPMLNVIEDAMGYCATYADLARDHAKLNDLPGLEYDMQVAYAHFRRAQDAFLDIQARHAKAAGKAAA